MQFVLFLLLLMVSFPSVSQAADIAAGKAKAIAVCAAGHGENGISTTGNVP